MNDTPGMFLDLEHVPSAVLASTILQHELFHAVQTLARSAHPVTKEMSACLAKQPHLQDMESLFRALSMEGTASYVGDLLRLPAHGMDEPTTRERDEFAASVALAKQRVTLLELSVRALGREPAMPWNAVYSVGFNGDQPLYGLGYVMARAVAQQQGDGAIGNLMSQSGAAFVLRYAALKSYGRDVGTPALDAETVRWAERVAACSSSPPLQ